MENKPAIIGLNETINDSVNESFEGLDDKVDQADGTEKNQGVIPKEFDAAQESELK